MQHRMGTGDLLDASGSLIERGWASAEVRRYDRRAIRASGWRIKEWDYYCIATDAHALALTVADNGYLGFLGVSWIDLEARTAINHGAVRPFPFGRMRMPASADSGEIDQRRGKLHLSFKLEPGARQLRVEAPDFAGGKGLSGAIRLEQPGDDRMVIATPFTDAPKAFYYNQKVNCMPASGEVMVAGEVFRFDPASAFGVLDWGRGVWTYDNTWYWASASGVLGARRFGFNLGCGFGDTSAASENMLFLDGRAHKLGEVRFELPPGRPDSGAWRLVSGDGRLDLRFDPIVDRYDRVDLGPFHTLQHQVFGRFSGQAICDDGSLLEISDLTGFAEKVHNRW